MSRRFSEIAIAKGSVIIVGLIILLVLLPAVSVDRFALIAFFLTCGVIAGFMDVHLSQGGSVSVDGAVVLAAIILLPLPEVLLVAAGGTIISSLIKQSWQERGGIGYVVAAKTVTASLASVVFHLFQGQVGQVDPVKGLPALVGMAAVYFALEIVMEEIGKLRGQVPTASALISSGKFLLPLYSTFASLGILLALLFGTMGIWSGLFFFLPLIVTRHSFKLYMHIRRVYANTIKALANTIEAQNPDRHGHAERVTDMAADISRELGIYGRELELVSYAALLHDIGLLGCDEDEIDEEGLDHAAVGAEIIEQVEYIRNAASMVRAHSAAYDEASPVGARIISVASRFDDLTNDVDPGNRMTDAQALARIKQDQGFDFDPKVVRALGSVLRKRGVVVRV
ncbi:MAG: HD-GYP domain-containing protein [Candidatus Aquicultorales bacterium]